jgi:RNA polymerase sigma factor (sigma-70 family)
MSVASGSSSVPAGVGQFPPTLWTMVLLAGGEPGDQAGDALAQLCQRYWYPLYAYLRRRGQSAHDAEDLTQGFFLHLLSRRGLAKVQRQRGKFRSFLLSSLQNYVSDEWDRSRAQKRGGGAALVSLDAQDAEKRYSAEPAGPMDPELLFEHRWAVTILDRALERLEAEYQAAGKAQRFEALRIFLTGEPQGVSYAETGARIGLSDGAVKVAVLRMRQRYRELVRGEIAHTIESEADIDEEMRHLLAILSR